MIDENGKRIGGERELYCKYPYSILALSTFRIDITVYCRVYGFSNLDQHVDN